MYTYKLSNLEKNLFDAMSKWEIIDCHEHLPSEKDRLNKKVDVFTLFSHYTYRDLIMAGMTEEQYLSLFNQDISLDIRWKMFAPYWKKIRWTSYSKAVLISTEKFYGFSDVNESTYKPISEAIKKANKPGIYEKVLRKACNIKTCLNQGIYWDDKRNNIEKIDPASTDLLTTVLRMPLRNRIEIDILRPSFDPDLVINSVDCYLDACRKYILKKKSEGAVGLKMMSHPYEIPNRQEAISIFKKIKAGSMNKIPPQPPHFIGTNSLRDYIIDELIRFAGEQNLVIAVHTGYWEDFRQLDPLLMIPILQRHPKVRFDIYHLGYPWVRETLMLGKGFPNVWLNFCWTHIISQKFAMSGLDEAIDLIPTNKILAFGGDYSMPVEKVYGHLVMAREDIARVLANRIKDGQFTETQALDMAKKWFWDNPIELYNLNIKTK